MNVKTNDYSWVNKPTIVVFSVHSKFTYGKRGFDQVTSLMRFIASYAESNVTVLLADMAHINTYALSYTAYDEAFKNLTVDAEALKNRCSFLFESYPVVSWQDFVWADPLYHFFKSKLKEIYQDDVLFRQFIDSEVLETYTSERAQKYPDKELYLMNGILDELEQKLIMLVGAKNGYYALLYPGKFHRSWQHLSKYYFRSNECLKCIEVKVSR